METNILKIGNKDALPISVIVPLGESKVRKAFFLNFTLPLIKANKPKEIIIVEGDNNAPTKRNYGFESSTEPFIFFCDDDILLPATHLSNLLSKLKEARIGNKNVSYSYTGYTGIVIDKSTHPMKGNFPLKGERFNPDKLKRGNYISTMALIVREHFPRFDETLDRFQDWDLWLTMLGKDKIGVLKPGSGFFAFYLDTGITSTKNKPSVLVDHIKNKHSI
jgi:glycosyltransferase involved in cell wall biosynthesis